MTLPLLETSNTKVSIKGWTDSLYVDNLLISDSLYTYNLVIQLNLLPYEMDNFKAMLSRNCISFWP